MPGTLRGFSFARKGSGMVAFAERASEVAVFNHEIFGEIRITDRDGKPWFVAKDVATALGYADPGRAVRAHCKGGGEMPSPSVGGTQTVKIIPESDVYRLVMRSRLPEAEKFQDWVVEEVLPEIRQARAMRMTNERLAAIEAKNEVFQEKIEEDAPKVEFHERVTGSDTVCQLGVACQVADLPFGRNTLFRNMTTKITISAEMSFDEIFTQMRSAFADRNQSLDRVRKCASLLDQRHGLEMPTDEEEERGCPDQLAVRTARAEAYATAASLVRQAIGDQRSFWNELSDIEEMTEAREATRQPDPDEGTAGAGNANESQGNNGVA